MPWIEKHFLKDFDFQRVIGTGGGGITRVGTRMMMRCWMVTCAY